MKDYEMNFNDEFNKLKKEVEIKTPAEWANEIGRQVGVGGVSVPSPGQPGKIWIAGRDDELDAFRHAFMNALAIAWGSIVSGSAKTIVNWIGNKNEKGKPICGARMDLYNNAAGQALAPSPATMIRWLLGGENPQYMIANAVAGAIREGKLITSFKDPRLPKECNSQAKIKGEYFVWRTVGDEDVRWEHVVKNGQVFRWDDAPELPGAAYNCRCWAEPLDAKYDEDMDKVFKK